jgi:hypothetical protein
LCFVYRETRQESRMGLLHHVDICTTENSLCLNDSSTARFLAVL